MALWCCCRLNRVELDDLIVYGRRCIEFVTSEASERADGIDVDPPGCHNQTEPAADRNLWERLFRRGRPAFDISDSWPAITNTNSIKRVGQCGTTARESPYKFFEY